MWAPTVLNFERRRRSLEGGVEPGRGARVREWCPDDGKTQIGLWSRKVLEVLG